MMSLSLRWRGSDDPLSDAATAAAGRSRLMEEARTENQESGSYRSILKSTSLIGGASVLNILIGMVRTKFVAVILGPNGVGLMGMFLQITGLLTTVSALGLGNSGVRQVAEAVAEGDYERTGQTVLALRRTIWIFGLLGLILSVVLCVPISLMTFGHDRYALSIAVLGVTVLFGTIATGEACLLQGTRHIGDLAKISVVGALSGTLISIPCLYVWGENGIVASLVFCSVSALVPSLWFARRLSFVIEKVSWLQSFVEARRLVTLGISFMGAGLMTLLSGYLIQLILVREFTLDGAGLYQSAFALSGVLVNFVLGAMGTDYYPRLTAVAGNNSSVHRMINEQSQISVLLSLPGLAAMMIFAPLIIKIFYAASFSAAVPILRWCIMGILGRVFSWPMGFVILAKGKGKVFLITEIFACVLHLAAVFLFTRVWGLEGAGVAFMALYVAYTVVMLFVINRLVGATWDRHTLKLVLLASAVMAVLMLNCTLDHMVLLWPINIVVLVVVTFLCLRQLSKKSDIGLHALRYKLRPNK
jgi:antigen flippase